MPLDVSAIKNWTAGVIGGLLLLGIGAVMLTLTGGLGYFVLNKIETAGNISLANFNLLTGNNGVWPMIGTTLVISGITIMAWSFAGIIMALRSSTEEVV